MSNRLTTSIVTAVIVLSIVAVFLVPALVAVAHFTPLTLPLLFQGAQTVGVIGIVIAVLGGW